MEIPTSYFEIVKLVQSSVRAEKIDSLRVSNNTLYFRQFLFNLRRRQS